MKKFNYPQFLRELEKEIDYVHGEVMKDYNNDIQFHRNVICQCNPLDTNTLMNASKEMNSLLEGINGQIEDKQYTLEFFKNPGERMFVGYKRDKNDPVDLLFVMAMITYFVDKVVNNQTLNCDYWMVEDDGFFGKVIRRSFI